ncbi:MAG TPA: hypothetical protein VI895_07600 [Bdellovibrionota bacterium]|nr:hypothetical protein [Bdellovibrionota bacterium]
MKIIASTFLVLALVGVASAEEQPATKTMTTTKMENCGEMIQSLIPLPTKFEELMTAVADGFEMHANWMATSTDKNAKAEGSHLKKLAADHRKVANQMSRIINDMEKSAKMKPAPHDMSTADPKAGEVMMKRAKLEREMAALMIQDAEKTEKMIATMNERSAAK